MSGLQESAARHHPGSGGEMGTIHVLGTLADAALCPVDLVVPFTGVRETQSALRAVRALAAGLRPRILLLVADVVPYPLPLDAPPVSHSVWQRRFEHLFDCPDAEVLVERMLCRAADPAWDRLLVRARVVVITQPTDRRWRRRVHRLQEHGVEVLIVPLAFRSIWVCVETWLRAVLPKR